MKHNYFLITVCFLFFLQSDLSAQTTEEQATKYVRMDIGHGGLHCPFLGPKLEGMLKEIENVNNIKIYKKESYATFELPAATSLSKDDLKKIGIKAGYPPDDVIVVISDSAPINQ